MGLIILKRRFSLTLHVSSKGKTKIIYMLTILDGCNLFATYNIRVLCDRCLVTISDKFIQMHDLTKQMGWEIVHEECPGDPSKWSRLWDVDDIYDAFSRQKV